MKNHSPKKSSPCLFSFNLKKQYAFILCFFVAFFFTQNKVTAQEPAPFECDGVFYHMLNGDLHALDVATSSFDLVNPGNNGYLNAMGFSLEDNLIYGIWHSGDNTPSNVLMRIDANGTWSNLGEIANLPIEKWNAGDFDSSGNLYVYKEPIQAFYKINIEAKQAIQINLNQYPTIADFSFNPFDGLFYGVTHRGNMATIDPINETVSLDNISGIVDDVDGGYGATWMTNEEILYIYRNYGGELYRVEGIETGFYVSQLQINTNEVSSRNDGANCVLGQDPFDDDDCDGVPDSDDLCDGGDDTIDNNNDGIPDCASFPGIDYIEESWLCGNGTFKIQVCHVPPGNPQNAQTLCLPISSMNSHSDHHDDYLGPCNVVTCLDDLQARPNNRPRNNQDNTNKNTVLAATMYPNPAQDLVKIRLNNVINKSVEIIIYNKLGQALYQTTTSSAKLTIPLSDSHFVTGIYVVSINTDTQIITKQLAITE